MTTPPSLGIPDLSADIFPFVADSKARTALARIESVVPSPAPTPDPEFETGILELKVLEVLAGPPPAVGAGFRVAFRRAADPQARVRQGFNQWNNLPLAPGRLLLVACDFATSDRDCQGLGAIAVESSADPAVLGLSRCYALERARGAGRLDREMLAAALGSESDLLFRYTLNLLVERNALSRDAAVTLIDQGVRSGQVRGERALDLVREGLGSGLFSVAGGADPPNVRLLALAAAMLIAEPEPRQRQAWARALASAVLREFSPHPKENAEQRRRLIASIVEPSAARVVQTLGAMAVAPGAGNPTIARDLKDAWCSATRAAGCP